ncbi:MAG: tyrosine-type recombinase/integrase [Lachnospiraceae bacterium]|nr:tyrosine-type recombinase/integrase [Lachnospiraceae bacterium]
MSTMQPIRTEDDIKRLKDYFLQKGEIRNWAMIVMGINLPIRISDILNLYWMDVYNFAASSFRKHLVLEEKKTGKKNILALNDNVVMALRRMQDEGDYSPEKHIFRAYSNSTTALTRVSAYLIIKKAADELGMEDIGCHSLRKTFGYHAWKKGVHLAVIMSIYNHSYIQVTKRYLGIEQDDKDEVMDLLQL